MKVDIKGRYEDTYPLEKIDDFIWNWNIPEDNHCRSGWTENRDEILFIDPEGGPFISIGTNLNLIHSNLPEEFVEKIWYDKEKKVFIFNTTNIENNEL